MLSANRSFLIGPLAVALALLCSCGGDTPIEAPAPVASGAPADHPAIAPLDADLDDPESLKAALEKNPGHAPILMRLAELALTSGKAEESAEYLRQLIAIEPGNAEARLELGRTLWEAGDREGAAAETVALLEIAPDHVDALYNLGAIYANQQQNDKAVEQWTRAVAVAPMSPSGQSAQRGLDTLAGKPMTIPDIPEHRGVATGQPKRIDAQDRQRIIDFAVQN